MEIKRTILSSLSVRFAEPRRFIQVLSGPRQTGKTTLARQLMDEAVIKSIYASADEPLMKGHAWIEQQWNAARMHAKSGKALIILDEIQKISGWSETIKRLWDEDTRGKVPLHALILGSSPLLVQGGLTESLAGRFEVIPVPHWSYPEMKSAFRWSLDRYLFFGGYPGSAKLISDFQRWSSYIKDSLIETTVSRDILLMKRVDKPALLRRLFELGCLYSSQVLSYHKMLGQLHDAGNTTTLSSYLDLLGGAGLLAGLPRYSSQKHRRRGSSPKLLVLNTALMNAASNRGYDEARHDTAYWGRVVESAVGAALANGIMGTGAVLSYWLSRNREVDYVLSKGDGIVAFEVKSGAGKTSVPGMDAFVGEFPSAKKILIGAQGIPLEEFFQTPVSEWLR
ncbi:MAG TPA: ATP-binding protein [Desulfomonilia bacterium]|nr:ATP-binding protein [Desulfomonilia bacterium]